MSDTTQKTKFTRPEYLVRRKSLHDLLEDLRKAQIWLMIAAMAAFLASAFFVVKYFAGGEMTPATWTMEQWMNAFLGLAITAVITAAQAFLYQSGYKGQAALVATLIVVFFGVFSEIAQSMEREDAGVRHRSENSPVFQATLDSIGTIASASATISAEQRGLAEARAHLDFWRGLREQKNADHHSVRYAHRTIDRNIEDFQRQVDAYNHKVQLQDHSRSSVLTDTIAQAKAMQYDENQHYAMIRLMGALFGVSGLWASFMFSVIIIGTFEYAFHFVGSYVADHKSALLLLGRDAQGNPINPKYQSYGDEFIQVHKPLARPPNDTEPVDADKDEPDFEKENIPPSGDVSQKRYFKVIYTDIRNRIINNELRPTIRPVTDTVSAIIREKGVLLGIEPANFGKPQRQKVAELILEQLAQEGVVVLNTEGGVGKPKYLLAEKYEQALSLNKFATEN